MTLASNIGNMFKFFVFLKKGQLFFHRTDTYSLTKHQEPRSVFPCKIFTWTQHYSYFISDLYKHVLSATMSRPHFLRIPFVKRRYYSESDFFLRNPEHCNANLFKSEINRSLSSIFSWTTFASTSSYVYSIHHIE